MKPKFYIGYLSIGLVSLAYHSLGLTKILPWSFTYTDVMVFAKRALSEGWIYVDKTIEYPVFIGVFISGVGKFSNSILQYYFLNSIILIGVGILCTYLLYQLLGEDKKSLWRYWILAPSMVLFLVYNWDIWALLFVILAFYFHEKNQNIWSAVSLGFGFLCKLYPALFLLPLLMRIKDWPTRIYSSVAFLATIILANIFFAFSNFHDWFFFFRYNTNRGADFGSIWSVLVPLFPPWLYDVQVLNAVSLVLFGICYGFLLWQYRKVNLIQLCFWITLLFLILNKVFSPQYILWLLPFFVLLNWKDKFSYYSLEIVNVLYLFTVLAFIFPPHYKFAEISSIIFMILRWIIICIILIASIKSFERNQIKYA